VLHAPAVLWPDTLALAADGHLYVSVNQLPRTPLFNGVDERVPPLPDHPCPGRRPADPPVPDGARPMTKAPVTSA
jgi:hypothetical protein